MNNRSEKPMDSASTPSNAVVQSVEQSNALSQGAVFAKNNGFAQAVDDSQVGGSASPSVSLRQILRHKWLFWGAFILVAGAAIPSIWLFTFPTYSATAIVRVAPTAPRLVFATENNQMVPLYRNYMNTQVSTIRSAKVLGRVLDRKEIQQTHWYKEEGKRLLRSPRTPLDRLVKNLVVRPRRDTELIEVKIATQKGNEAKLIVDTVVDEYDKLMKEREREEFLDIIDKVRTRYKILQDDIKGLQELRHTLANDSGLMDSEELRSQLSTTLMVLDTQRMEIERDLAMLNSQQKVSAADTDADAENADGTGISEDAKNQTKRYYAEDPEWRSLEMTLKNARFELERDLRQYGPLHPNIEQSKSNVTHAEKLLRDHEAQLDEQWEREAQVQTFTSGGSAGLGQNIPLEQSISSKERLRDLLLKDIENERGKIAAVQRIARYDEQIRQKQQEFEDVHRRLVALETEGKAPGRIEIASYAVLPSEPDRDRRPLLTIMALGGAMMFGLALAYLRTSMDTRIYEVGDIQHISLAPFMERVPLVSSNMIPRELGGSSEQALFELVGHQRGGNGSQIISGLPILLESIRMVRTALLERLNGPGQRTILVTSPTSGSGKTSTTLLLARSLAIIGKKVLLVESDTHRSPLSKRLDIKSKTGLAAMLTGDARDVQAIQQTNVPNLYVLPIGEMTTDFSPEIFANGVFSACIQRWKKLYDFILLDSPPVLLQADARILASNVDGTLLVLRASHDHRVEAQEAYRILSATGSEVLGIVLVGGKSGRGYEYAYRDDNSANNGSSNSVISPVDDDCHAAQT